MTPTAEPTYRAVLLAPLPTLPRPCGTLATASRPSAAFRHAAGHAGDQQAGHEAHPGRASADAVRERLAGRDAEQRRAPAGLRPDTVAGMRRASSAVTTLVADHSSISSDGAERGDAEGQADEAREVRHQRDHPGAGGQRRERGGDEGRVPEQREVEHRRAGAAPLDGDERAEQHDAAGRERQDERRGPVLPALDQRGEQRAHPAGEQQQPGEVEGPALRRARLLRPAASAATVTTAPATASTQ